MINIDGPRYVVLMGRNPGIYKTWEEVLKETKGFLGASFKKCNSKKELEEYLDPNNKKKIKDLEIRQTEFLSKTNTLNIYIDGSFCNITNIYSFGFAVVKNDDIIHYNSGSEQNDIVGKLLNNNSSEMKAAMEAIHYACKMEHKSVIIYHDNLPVRDLVEGIIQPKNIFEEKYVNFMHNRMNKYNLRVNFTKVKAHNGNKFNEFVDTIAKTEMRLKRDGFDFLLNEDLNIHERAKIRKQTRELLIKLLKTHNDFKFNGSLTRKQRDKLAERLFIRLNYLKINIPKCQINNLIEKNIDYAIDSIPMLEKIWPHLNIKERNNRKSLLLNICSDSILLLMRDKGRNINKDEILEYAPKYVKDKMIKKRLKVSIENIRNVITDNYAFLLDNAQKRFSKEFGNKLVLDNKKEMTKKVKFLSNMWPKINSDELTKRAEIIPTLIEETRNGLSIKLDNKFDRDEIVGEMTTLLQEKAKNNNMEIETKHIKHIIMNMGYVNFSDSNVKIG